MKPIARVWKVAGASALGVGLAWWGYLALYAWPYEQRREAIDRETARVRALEEQLEEGPAIRRRLRAVAATTLGKKEDLVIAHFRDGLSAIAERHGLTGVVVSSGSASVVQNPARGTRIPSALRKKLDPRRGDFSAIKGRLKASGPLENVLRVLAEVQAQPWAHRVDGFSLTPTAKDRDWMEIQIDVATMFVPDLASATSAPLPSDAASGADTIWRSIAAKNMFKMPPPPPAPVPSVSPPVTSIAAVPAPPPAPVAAPPPPYQDWKVVGIISRASSGTEQEPSGSSGSVCEVTVVNTRTGERSTITPGGKALDATLVQADGERAVFDINGQKFEFLPGDTLAGRTPARS